MIIKSHLCGIAVAFDRFEGEHYEDNGTHAGKFFDSTYTGRPQGSLYSQQKRKIADACEYLRTNSTYEPLIFVCTSPGFTDLANEKKLISAFTHNLRNGYRCKNFVWVREFTQMGYPHFHFVADMPRFNAIDLSLYWSGLFGVHASNSVRLGIGHKNGKRTYVLKSKRLAWYMAKYIGKSIGNAESGANKTARIRRFAVSQELAKLSAPQEFKSKMVRVETGRQVMTIKGLVPFKEDIRIWQNCTASMTDKEAMSRWNWKETGFANTYLGYPKQWKL